MSRKRISFNEAYIDSELLKMSRLKGEEDQLRKIAKKALQEVVAQDLTQRQKQFVVLYYYDNHTMDEIADLCGVNVSTVSRTLRRARNNIMDKIKYYFIRTEEEE